MSDQQQPTAETGTTSPVFPSVTPERIESVIKEVQFGRFPGTTVTVCCMTLINGFNIVGKSACASPENFDAAMGERLAYDDAKRQIWQLEGYLLRQWLYLGESGQLTEDENKPQIVIASTADMSALSKGEGV